MTMPGVFPRVAADPSLAIAPNAAQVGVPVAHDADAAITAQFGAVLTLMLGHVAKPAPSVGNAASSSEEAEAPIDAEAESSDASPSALPGHVAVSVIGEPLHATESPTGRLVAPMDENGSALLGVATGAELGERNGTAGVEAAADAVLDAAAQQSLVAVLASPMVVGSPPIVAPLDLIAPSDAKTVNRDMELLAPEFRARLERVIERMESEFGYRVEVTETFRSQARQNALFAQGRTDGGPVVTWTRASNHTAGRAADLVINGTYDDVVPYERLMRVAREEGLRTLGPRDPGHIELPSSSTVAAGQGSADEATKLSMPSDLRAAVIARPAASVASQASIAANVSELERPALPQVVAQVARVAAVSPIAQVATVAQVAAVGAQAAPVVHPAARGRAGDVGSTRGTSGRRPVDGRAPGAVAAETLSPVPGGPLSAANSDAATTDGGREGLAAPNDDRRSRSRVDQAAARDGATQVLAQAREELMRAVAGTDPSATTSSTGTREASSASLGHADMSERIARLLKVQDAASDRPLSQVMLRLERPDGGVDRVRVDLRGNTVSATLDVGDQGAADRLTANVKELQTTLERHGFATDSLTVRTTSRPMESSTLARAAGAAVEADLQRTAGSSSSNTNTSSRERGARQDEQRPSPDSQRQRSRREQKGDR